ncbi:MAG: VWA domain-containing protein [Bacteroidota bacterium]
MKQSLILLVLGLLLGSAISFGGGKEAYRNYFLGSYYFAEGDFGRAENHLRRAYQLHPQQFNFALAYALSLGQREKTDAALEVLGHGKALLRPRHPDYAHLASLQHFVTGMIQLYGKRYGQAIRPLRRAIAFQEALPYPEERSIMLNALGYAQIMNQGKGSGAHGGLAPHYHVHRRDIEQAHQSFLAAYQADVQNSQAAENYNILSDTLGLERVAVVEDSVVGRDKRELKSYQYAALPANVQPLLKFVDYDEVVFLLDISGSMVMEQVTCIADDRFNVMRETAQLLLANFADSTKVGIGTIGGDCGTEPKLWHPAGELSRKDLGYALRFLVPDGTTPLLTILQETSSLFTNDPNTSKALIFISDGENVCRLPGVDICEWTSTLASQQITINIMTFLGASLDNTNAFAEYTCLTENTFGRLLYLDGNRCRLEEYRFDLVKACRFAIPPLERVNCWGKATEGLWAIFPE